MAAPRAGYNVAVVMLVLVAFVACLGTVPVPVVVGHVSRPVRGIRLDHQTMSLLTSIRTWCSARVERALKPKRQPHPLT
jgi:hypothetical protein